MNVSPARVTAFRVLTRVAEEAAWASNLLSSSEMDWLSAQDRGLAHELCLGVLRWQGKLDFVIESFSKRSKLDLPVLQALRLGIYQLLFLDRIPVHAAINESVNLVKLQKKVSAAPFVNGVLRNVHRAGAAEVERRVAAIRDPEERLSIETSHPRWLLRRWLKRLGIDATRALALANNLPPRQAIRLNPARDPEGKALQWLQSECITTVESILAPGAFVVERGHLSGNAMPVTEGWIYFQDEASQLVSHLVAAPRTEGLRILDLCAAPGSKTSLIASLLPGRRLTVACDRHIHRLNSMQKLFSRSGVENILLCQLDASKRLPFADETSFDRVLLDAPCTGLGTLQRHPEIKWRLDPQKIGEMAALQKLLLENAAKAVRRGGAIAYSVCSTEPEEGEQVVDRFLRESPDFESVTAESAANAALTATLASPPGLRTFPHLNQTEGFFVAVLRRQLAKAR